jgi:hypothetical protein
MQLDTFEVLVIQWLRHIDHRLEVLDHKIGGGSDGPMLQFLTDQLQKSSNELQIALAPYLPQLSPANSKGITVNPILQSLADQVTATTSAEASAVTLINGIAQRIADAVAAAIAGGATAAQLQPVTDEVTALKASADALSAAIAANTPSAPSFKKK